MGSLGVEALAGWLAIVGLGAGAGACGWIFRRKREELRRRAHEATFREQINAAGRARDRAREEAQEVDERLQRLKDEHSGCSVRIDELERTVARLSGLEAQIAAASAELAELATRLEVSEGQHKDGAPNWLLSAPKGRKDDLKDIRGLGPVLERDLNRLGVFHFHQLARMTTKDVHWLAGRINAFSGLNKRYRWADQARMKTARPNGGNGDHSKKRI